MRADLLATLRRWEDVTRRRDELAAEAVELAKPLEEAAMALRGWRYARLMRQDRDGRLRFFTLTGESTLPIEELAGGAQGH